MKRVLSPDFISAAFIWIKTSLFMLLLDPAGICGVMWEERRGKKVIHASPLSHMEVQQSAQPVLTPNDGLFEWSAQPLRITRWKKKGKMSTDTSVLADCCSLEALVGGGGKWAFPDFRECVGIVSF